MPESISRPLLRRVFFLAGLILLLLMKPASVHAASIPIANPAIAAQGHP
jgi:hypothetical protein